MGVWIAGCLEDQTPSRKGDGETVVFKEVRVVRIYGFKKKAGVSMGTSSALLCITAHTERTDMYFTFRKSVNAHTARLPLEIIELPVFLFLNFTFPNPAVFLCCSLSLCIYNPFLDISQVNLKCRSNSFTYRIYSPFSVTH